MELSSGELIGYLKTHFKLYKWVNTDILSEELNISIVDKVVDDNGYITGVKYIEKVSGVIIKF